jgi:proteasome beta subunit
MSVIMFERRYAPLLTQVIMGGVDESARVFVLDPLGSVIPDAYAAVGTGAEMAIGVVESGYSSSITEKEAKDLLISGIKAAIQRDAASGNGLDILTINRSGMKEEGLNLQS